MSTQVLFSCINTVIGESVPQGYDILHTPRLGQKGGGVAVVFNKDLDVKLHVKSRTLSIWNAL